MTHRTLRELYEAHPGKASDKWNLYMEIYEELFARLRGRAIDLLEIGVQNGGSLELWGKYFECARNLVGCDIDARCAGLSFDDPRIRVVVGDAGAEGTAQRILSAEGGFDVIIDDGSHRSGDIIRCFGRYFLRAEGRWMLRCRGLTLQLHSGLRRRALQSPFGHRVLQELRRSR